MMKCGLKLLAMAFALLGALVLFPASASADADANSYTVELRYDDAIQISYQHPDADGWWRGAGDIPLGGATLNGVSAIPQLYCVDALIPFHSRVAAMGGSTTWLEGRTTDKVPNYVVVSPDKLPEALKSNWNELLWLTLNGYSDDGSLTALNSAYSDLADSEALVKAGQAIPYEVAVMATKVAVWHFTNPEVAYYSTSFLAKSIAEASAATPPRNTASGIKHRQFVALAKRLIADAAAYAANPSAQPPLGIPQPALAIDDSNAGPLNGGYYGPYQITDGNNVLKGDDLVFLDRDGPASSGFGGIGFYTANEDGTFSAIPGNLQKYGGTDMGPGIKKDQEFYISVPPGLAHDGVSINALSRTTTAAAVRMPVVLVHQDPESGAQDWNAVQAFIGLANANIDVTVYGQAVLPLGIDTGTIRVSKAGGGEAAGKEFSFRLTDASGNPVDLGSLSVTPAIQNNPLLYNGEGSDGVFRLTAGGGRLSRSKTSPWGTTGSRSLCPARSIRFLTALTASRGRAGPRRYRCRRMEV
ncbi:MAG: thioester domain-containing protein [Clostridiales Family XIII bacterium]|jgi:hypothetical protein|nr:thioester domain-containing protein [Clostridiales Family XIII bacterium]